jgi:L-aminopeptidase/D-esterase-like protein
MGRGLLIGIAMALALPVVVVAQAPSDQSALKPMTASIGPTLQFDWPAVQIGIGSYEEGPTGLTIFKFPHLATAVVDVRGGAPGTVNTDALRLGYDSAFVNAIVFAGSSAYGEEAITAVATGLKDAGETDGTFSRANFVAGAIIYDFTGHRLNEVYPDKRLAQEALKDLHSGVFPLGAQGAGRMAMQGSYLGCGAHSGQGGAFRQIGAIKIATITVINAVGSIVDRSGKLVRCHRDANWNDGDSVSDLLSRASTGVVSPKNTAGSSAPTAPEKPGPTTNTTISLVITNRKMSASELQRLAVQVHTSMARAIQPYSTVADGDTLYAASTQEVDVPQTQISDMNMGVAAGELMWDAILASVPSNVTADAEGAGIPVSAERLKRLTGHYSFGGQSAITIKLDGSALAIGSEAAAFFDIPHGKMVHLVPMSDRDFYVHGRYRTRISFTLSKRGEATGAVIDPGPWQQRGERLK